MSYIAKMIARRRKALGLTRSELARLLGLPYKRIWEWETGAYAPRAANVDRLVAALDRAAAQNRKKRR